VGGVNTYGYVGGNPLKWIDRYALDIEGYEPYEIPDDGGVSRGIRRGLGASILGAAPGINSGFERQLIDHYFFDEGRNFYMSPEQMSRYNQNPNSSEFDYGIGRSNPNADGRIDRYDFDPQPWGNRQWSAEVATRIGRFIGDTFGGVPFDIFPNREELCR